VIIWFNLFLLTNGHLVLLDTVETLEDCQSLQMWYQTQKEGDYRCHWVQVEKL